MNLSNDSNIGSNNVMANTNHDGSQEQFIALIYDGTLKTLFVRCVKNLLLYFFTLGLYSFWGRTRIRQYLTSSLRVNNDRFEFTGAGGELLLGYLKALFFISSLVIF